VSASGMNAATTMLLALVPQNGHIVTTTDCYFGTRQFIQKVLPKMGITVSSQPPMHPVAVCNAMSSLHSQCHSKSTTAT